MQPPCSAWRHRVRAAQGRSCCRLPRTAGEGTTAGRRRLEAARAAGADVYAPIEFRDAQASLKKYDDAVAQRDYRLALNDALEARDRAYEAVKQAGDKKAELRSQTDRLVQEPRP
jgi:hypothetical protein